MKLSYFYIPFFAILLSGCTAIPLASNCIDAKFARKPIPISGVHAVSMQVNDKTHNFNLECEKYYAAQCSVRGNFWDVRVKRNESENYTGNVTHELPSKHIVKFTLPQCKALIKYKQLNVEMLQVTIGRGHYAHHFYDENHHTFKLLYKNRYNLPEEIKVYIDIDYKFKPNTPYAKR